MSTGAQIVLNALTEIGIQTELENASAETKSACFAQLQSLLAELKKKLILLREKQTDGSYITIAEPTTDADELNEPLASRNDLERLLAVRFAAKARFPITPVLQTEGGKSYSRLAQMYRVSPVVLADQSELLPRGQGGRSYGRLGEAFFPGSEQ